jgi:hypothetical protein
MEEKRKRRGNGRRGREMGWQGRGEEGFGYVKKISVDVRACGAI